MVVITPKRLAGAWIDNKGHEVMSWQLHGSIEWP